MTMSPRKNVPDVGTELEAACMPSEIASDRATASGSFYVLQYSGKKTKVKYSLTFDVIV